MGTLPLTIRPAETHAIGAETRAIRAEIRHGNFYTLLALALNAERVAIDARPRDAIARALRAGAPTRVQAADFGAAGAARASDDHRQPNVWRATRGRAPATRRVEL